MKVGGINYHGSSEQVRTLEKAMRSLPSGTIEHCIYGEGHTYLNARLQHGNGTILDNKTRVIISSIDQSALRVRTPGPADVCENFVEFLHEDNLYRVYHKGREDTP